MANYSTTHSNGKHANGKNHSNGLILPFKRKASDHHEEGEDGSAPVTVISKELKHAVQDYIDLKLKVKDYLAVKSQLSSLDDSCKSPYPDVAGLPNAYCTFRLGHGGLSERRRESAIDAAKKYHARQISHFLGYQVNYAMEYADDFSGYMDMHINNIGDAFKEGNLTVNSKFMERPVLDYYAELWNGKAPHSDTDLESYWGFCLSMGSTEGNLYGSTNQESQEISCAVSYVTSEDPLGTPTFPIPIDDRFQINGVMFKVQASTIQGAGLGLFSYSSLTKGVTILHYGGDKYHHNDWKDICRISPRASKYSIIEDPRVDCVDDWVYIVGDVINGNVVRYINNCHGMAMEPNVRYVLDPSLPP